MKAPLSYVPALPAAIGMMAGIVFFYSGLNWIFCAAIVVSFVACVIFRRYWTGFLCLFGAIGWIISALSLSPAPPDSAFGSKKQWHGEISSVRYTADAVRLTVDIATSKNQPAKFKCSLLLPTPDFDYQCGDEIEFTAKFRPVDSHADLPDEISYNPTAFVDGVTAEAYISPDAIDVTGFRVTPGRVANQLKDQLLDLIYTSPVNSHTAWFLSATLLGDDSMLDTSIRQQFRSIGIAHYLALSGFHVGIIAMFAGLLLFPFKTWSHAGRYRHIAVIMLIWTYAFVCGMSASLFRAATLISIFLMAKVLQRQSSPYNSLAIAAIIILTASPRQLFAPGFQLSFAAVLSILAFAPLLNPFKRHNHAAYTAAEFITVPLAAVLGTSLITIVHFHRFPLLFLIPNLAMGVLMPLMLCSGVVLIAATACGIKFTLLGTLLNLCNDCIEHLCNIIGGIEHAEITGIFFSQPAILAGVAATAFLAMALIIKQRIYIICFIATVFIFATALIYRQPLPDAELYITRQSTRTDIIIREGSDCIAVTSGKESDFHTIASFLSRRYANFLARRNCSDSIKISSGDFNFRIARRKGDYIIFGDKLILAPLSSRPEIRDIHTDYLLITRAAGAKPESIIKRVKPDTVLLAADLPPKRAERLTDSCSQSSIPVKKLSDAPFKLLR